jgi:hypothetical protein
MRTVRRLYKRIGGPLPSHDLTKLNDLVERLAAENSILKARISGFKTAVFIEKGRRKRAKPVFQNIHTLDEGKARFWLTKKFQEARHISKDQEDQKEQDIIYKAQEKEDKRKKKEEQARMVIQRRPNREQEAQKRKQDKEEIKAQSLATKQLQNELQAVTPNPKTRSKALVPKKKVVINIEFDWEDDEVEMVTPRPRREIKPPRHLIGFDCS